MSHIFDIQESINNANGNIALAKDLFTMLLDELPERQQQITQAFNEHNYTDLLEYAHKIFGATAYCAVPDLRKSAAILENALKKGDHTKLGTLYSKLISDIDCLVKDGPAFLLKEWEI